jgi:hypothetical protein
MYKTPNYKIILYYMHPIHRHLQHMRTRTPKYSIHFGQIWLHLPSCSGLLSFCCFGCTVIRQCTHFTLILLPAKHSCCCDRTEHFASKKQAVWPSATLGALFNRHYTFHSHMALGQTPALHDHFP